MDTTQFLLVLWSLGVVLVARALWRAEAQDRMRQTPLLREIEKHLRQTNQK